MWRCIAPLAIGLGLPQAVLAAPCPPQAQAWARTCADHNHLDLQLSHCPEGGIVLSVAPSVAPQLGLQVEIARAPRRGFAQIGPWAISPVGEFADWSQEPPARRQAFAEVLECAQHLSQDAVPHGELSPSSSAPGGPSLRRSPAPFPILVLISLVGLAFAGWALHRKRGWAAVGAMAGVGASQAVLVTSLPFRYAHQNGQGPTWVRHALWEHQGLADYGPGYREIFGWVAQMGPSAPEVWIQGAQSALSGLAAASVAGALLWARGGITTAAGLAILVSTLDPIRLWAASSESYFGPIGAALSIAAALSFVAGSLPNPRHQAGVAVLAALWIALAVRVHPLAWAPAALVPLAAIATIPPNAPDRTARWGRLAAAVAVVVLATAGPTILQVWFGPVGLAWGPAAGRAATSGWSWLAPAAAAGLAGLSLRPNAPAWLWPTALAGLLAASLWAVHLLQSEAPRYAWAWFGLGAPAAALILCSWSRWPRWVLALAAAGILALGAWRLPEAMRFSTDAREAAWAMEWRHEIEDAAPVVWLARAGDRIVDLPLYAHPNGASIAVRPLSTGAGETRAIPRDHGPAAYVVRTSLCATLEGQPACDILFSAPGPVLHQTELPAQPSRPLMPYPVSTVPVGVYAPAAPRAPR